MPARRPSLLAAPPEAEGRLWLTNARLFDGTDGDARSAAAVLVDAGRITRSATPPRRSRTAPPCSTSAGGR